MKRGEWQSIFGDNLASILREKGMSQKELARDSKIPAGAISDYINKFSTPSIISVINLSYALDEDIDDLIDFDEEIDIRKGY